jgi:copper homeostasis protein
MTYIPMTIKPIILEVCVDSLASCVAAEQGGAARVELCSSLFEGGLTPSAGMIKLAREKLTIPMNVIIRPRGGDFCYSDEEFACMRYDIQQAKELGADGVVIGILLPNGHVDIQRTAELVELAHPLSITFHRAFDMVVDPIQALEELVDLKIDRILTSGQERTVLEGSELLAKLIKLAGNRIIIMPGGGVTERNIQRIVRETGAQEIHVSGRKKMAGQMTYRNERVFMGGELRLPEYDLSVVDADKITRFQKSANQ